MSKLIAAAIQFKGITFTGTRHGDCIGTIANTGFGTEADKPLTDKNSTQGFIDDKGVFYSREDARDIAIQCNQVPWDHGTLYSEDLW